MEKLLVDELNEYLSVDDFIRDIKWEKTNLVVQNNMTHICLLTKKVYKNDYDNYMITINDELKLVFPNIVFDFCIYNYIKKCDTLLNLKSDGMSLLLILGGDITIVVDNKTFLLKNGNHIFVNKLSYYFPLQKHDDNKLLLCFGIDEKMSKPKKIIKFMKPIRK